MQVINLREPCYAQEPDGEVRHIPSELCSRLFGWETACQAIEIILRDEVKSVDFYALVSVDDMGLILAAAGELGTHHYFIPWSNVIAVHGHVST